MVFEIFKSKSSDDYYFRLKAGNGQNILGSNGYTSKAAIKNGIESVKINAIREGAFQKKESSNSKYYFNLKAANNHVIGKSQMYESKQGMNNGIESVRKNAPEAEVVDLTIQD